jgi:hypothetical protein
MLICYHLRRPADDAGLADYIRDIEVMVGSAPIAKRAMAQMQWITGYTSLWWPVQRAGIESRLPEHNVVMRINDGTAEELTEALHSGPVIIGTNKLPGLRGGHIVLVVGDDGENWIVHDPFGDATTAYVIRNGAYVRYNKTWLKGYTENVTGQVGKIRIMYAQRK